MTYPRSTRWLAFLLPALLVTGLVGSVVLRDLQAAVPPLVLKAEAERVAVIAKVRPAVAAVCFYGGKACGSGVVIDPEGYCLTNFHVVQPTGPVMQCGLADGLLYDAVLVGTDKVGDVALVKLLPKKEGTPFPYVKLADSDKVQVGDWSLAMGNPFGLALDFSPTVTYGVVSGVNRYQPPAGSGTLEYTDCIQIDTSINPGNSGGPLFNMKGELIGINGRGSFEKRGRVNSGVGYAISINQIKNFLGHLYSGIDTDHATLGALVRTENEEGDLSKMVVAQILDDSDAARRGIQPGDQILRFAGRPLTSTNQYKNILGIFPKGWRLPITYRRDNQRHETLVRLMGNIDTPVEDPNQPMPPPKGPRPARPGPAENQPPANAPAKKLYIAKKGYANYYFNKLRQDELLEAFQKNHGNFRELTGPWSMSGSIQLADRKSEATVTWKEADDGRWTVTLKRPGIDDPVTPLKPNQPLGELQLPTGSGGLLVSLYLYHRLLVDGVSGFELGFSHGGMEPFYPPPTDGEEVGAWADRRVDCNVLLSQHASFRTKWYFDKKDDHLLGCEVLVTEEDDPCELYFSDYKPVDGRRLPHRIVVRHGDKQYGVLTLNSYTLAKK